MVKIFALIIAALVAFLVLPDLAKAESMTEHLEYIGKIEFSAYWPHEDSYNNNFKCEPLESLVGEIVACPTGSDLLGKEILIMTEDHQLLRRRVWDTGCKPGRMDMLVGSSSEMWAWGNEGLQDCHVWVLES